jgi:uncharacterized protein with HEPN domain
MQPDLFDLGRLQDMLDAARAAKEYLGERTLEQLLADRMLCDAIERRIEIIGEAASRISSAFRVEHAEIPWRQIIATRNILVHNYAQVSHVILHGIVAGHLPEMIMRIEAILPPPPPDPLPETTEGQT